MDLFRVFLFFMKLFDPWSESKKHLDARSLNDKFRVHEREVWWCSLGVNIGDEEDGKNDLFERPVLIIRKFNNGLVWCLPMSTKIKDSPFYFPIEHDGITFSIILSQLRVISTKRFQRHIRKI
jgi:mRNA interferase MazF